MAGKTKLVVELTGDEEKLLNSFRKASAADETFRRSTLETGKAGEAAAKQFANAWIKGPDKAKTSLDAMLRTLKRSGPEGKQAALAIEKQMATAGTHGRESISSIINRIGDIDQAAANAGRDAALGFEKADKGLKGLIGDQAVAQVGKFATAWLSVATISSTVRQGLDLVRQANEDALASLKGNAGGDKRLIQIAESKEDFGLLRKMSDELSTKYGISREESRQLMFSARSEGFEQAADFIAGNQQIIGVEAQATVAGQLPGLFVNEKLTPQQAINQTLAGAAASRLSFEDIARALPAAAASTSLIGSDSVETTGVLSVLAGRFKSAETGADRIAAFAAKVNLDEGVTEADIEAAQKKQEGKADAARKAFRTLTERRDDIAASIADRESAELKTPEQRKSNQKRINDLQQDLQRAKRAVSEFDQSTLQAQPVTIRKRDSLDGQGLQRAVLRIRDEFSEKERREFLGESKELNEAYELLAEEFGRIETRIQEIRKARDNTGTDASPIAIRRQAVASDPKLVAALQTSRADIFKEVEREDRRAVEVAKRKASAEFSIGAAEKSGVSDLQIGLTEWAAGITETYLRPIIGVGEDQVAAAGTRATLRPLFKESSFFNLERDLNSAVSSGDTDAGAALLATRKLAELRRQDPEALLGQQDVASFLNLKNPGTFRLPGSVTDSQRQSLTDSIAEAASRSPGSLSTIATAFSTRDSQRRGSAFADSIGQGITERTGQRMLQEQQETNRLLRESVDSNNRTEKHTSQTEQNTRPDRNRGTSAQQAAASAANSRAGR